MTGLEWFLLAAVAVLGVLATAYRIQRDYFATEVLAQYAWIDEIIEELESDE